jgi:hypothetical protein
MQLYVKKSSNCGGMPLMTVNELSPTWLGDSLLLPFGEDGDQYTVIGLTDLVGQPVCPVRVVHARVGVALSTTGDPADGYLVYGGNWGVRILKEDVDVPDFLPSTWLDEAYPGVGQPIIWVEDLADLPEEVQVVVSQRTAPYSIEELAQAAISVTGETDPDRMLSLIRGRIQRDLLRSEKVGKFREIPPDAALAFLDELRSKEAQR